MTCSTLGTQHSSNYQYSKMYTEVLKIMAIDYVHNVCR